MPASEATAPPTLATTGNKMFQAPWSYLGLPVVSLPISLDENGMPIAVQLVAPYHHDAELLDIAAWCEQQIAFDSRPPLI
jgi:Asp-tRNA(Asn)/Glu-tRNA(Gln) amidotransferase A subunit family amidase